MSREREYIREEIKKEVAEALERKKLKTKKMLANYRDVMFKLAETSNDLEDAKIVALKRSVGIELNPREHWLVTKYTE